MKLYYCRIALLGIALSGLINLRGHAQAIVPVFQDNTNQPGYVTSDYRFTGLDSEHYPGYPSLEGSSGGVGAWPSPIAADGGSLTASLNRLDPTQTTDFLSGDGFGGGVYAFFSETVFTISQSAPLANASSLTLQVFQAQGIDPDATDNAFVGVPTLTLNLADSTQQVLSSGPGVVLSSTPAFIFGQNTSLNDTSFTFDLSGITQEISSYTIDWTTAMHSITYGADVTEVEAVPEPSTTAMMILSGIGCLILSVRRRKRRAQIA